MPARNISHERVNRAIRSAQGDHSRGGPLTMAGCEDCAWNRQGWCLDREARALGRCEDHLEITEFNEEDDR